MSSENPNDLSALIFDAPEALWNKIRRAFSVSTRQEAVELILKDEKARRLLISITSEPESSLLTQKKSAPAAIARDEQIASSLYPTHKARIKI